MFKKILWALLTIYLGALFTQFIGLWVGLKKASTPRNAAPPKKKLLPAERYYTDCVL